MDRKIIKEIERFNAKSDDGQIFTVIISQEYIVTRSLQGRSQELPGLKVAMTSDGSYLNFIDENKFEIVETGTVISKF